MLESRRTRASRTRHAARSRCKAVACSVASVLTSDNARTVYSNGSKSREDGPLAIACDAGAEGVTLRSEPFSDRLLCVALLPVALESGQQLLDGQVGPLVDDVVPLLDVLDEQDVDVVQVVHWQGAEVAAVLSGPEAVMLGGEGGEVGAALADSPLSLSSCSRCLAVACTARCRRPRSGHSVTVHEEADRRRAPNVRAGRAWPQAVFLADEGDVMVLPAGRVATVGR